jgi:hypothetical protein
MVFSGSLQSLPACRYPDDKARDHVIAILLNIRESHQALDASTGPLKRQVKKTSAKISILGLYLSHHLLHLGRRVCP